MINSFFLSSLETKTYHFITDFSSLAGEKKNQKQAHFRMEDPNRLEIDLHRLQEGSKHKQRVMRSTYRTEQQTTHR